MISASDALTAVKALYDIANKVQDNKNELLRLLQKIEHIVETLNECRSDINRSDEYNDALSAIFDIITHTQTLTQRLVKRNLFDRTWNTSQIASEISKLNDDVQNYLNVHMVQVLGILVSSNVEHHNVLANKMEEIRVMAVEDQFTRTKLIQELRDLTDFLQRTPSPAVRSEHQETRQETPHRTVYMVDASVGRTLSEPTSYSEFIPLPPAEYEEYRQDTPTCLVAHCFPWHVLVPFLKPKSRHK